MTGSSLKIVRKALPTPPPLPPLPAGAVPCIDFDRPPGFLALNRHSAGFLQPDSPLQGFMCTLDGSLMAIMHCRLTRRMTMANFDRVPDWSAFEEHFRYLVDDQKDVYIEIIFTHGVNVSDDDFLTGYPVMRENFAALARSACPKVDFKLDCSYLGGMQHVQILSVEKGWKELILYEGPPGWLATLRPLNRSFEYYWTLHTMIEGQLLRAFKARVPIWKLFDGLRQVAALPPPSLGMRALLLATFNGQINLPSDIYTALSTAMRLPTEIRAQMEHLNLAIGSAAALGQVKKDDTPYCLVCTSHTSVRRCSGCKGDYWCSVEHQKLDWSHHREWCKKRKELGLV